MPFEKILGSPQILRPARLVVNGRLLGSTSNNNSRIPETDSRDPETETGSLETELLVHRIHGTLETRLHMIPRSLVAISSKVCTYVLIDFAFVDDRFDFPNAENIDCHDVQA